MSEPSNLYGSGVVKPLRAKPWSGLVSLSLVRVPGAHFPPCQRPKQDGCLIDMFSGTWEPLGQLYLDMGVIGVQILPPAFERPKSYDLPAAVPRACILTKLEQT